MAVRERAYAKINLTLVVRGRRTDGYHELESLVTFADASDVVTFAPGTPGGVTTTGPFVQNIDGDNLLSRTLALLADAEPRLRLGSVALEKNLPVAAGLGGGSADAAALLRAIRRANPNYAADVPWLAIAARLGADVPVCLDARPVLMWGIGERLAPVPHLPDASAVIVNPRLPLSTAGVFAALGAGPAPLTSTAPAAPDLPQLSDLLDYMRALGNDLETPAMGLLPAIAEVKAALLAEPGCQLAAMSGSGPTCFGIFADAAQARQAADRIAGLHDGWWVQAVRLHRSAAA